MKVLNDQEVDTVSGAVSDDARYGAALAAAVGLLAIAALPVTAVSATVAGVAYGGSLFSSIYAMAIAW